MKKKKKITTRFDTHVSRAELTEEVPPRKFDRHMAKARKDDIHSRRQMFIAQSDADEDREHRNGDITPSVY